MFNYVLPTNAKSTRSARCRGFKISLSYRNNREDFQKSIYPMNIQSKLKVEMKSVYNIITDNKDENAASVHVHLS